MTYMSSTICNFGGRAQSVARASPQGAAMTAGDEQDWGERGSAGAARCPRPPVPARADASELREVRGVHKTRSAQLFDPRSKAAGCMSVR